MTDREFSFMGLGAMFALCADDVIDDGGIMVTTLFAAIAAGFLLWHIISLGRKNNAPR